MSRHETTTIECGEPKLVYLRRSNAGSPIELCIVEEAGTRIYTVGDGRALAMAADITGFLATRPRP